MMHRRALGFEDAVSYNALTIGELGYPISGTIATTKLFDPVTSQPIPCDPQRPMACQVVAAVMCAPKGAHPGAQTIGCIRDDKGNQGEENEGRGNWGEWLLRAASSHCACILVAKPAASLWR